MITGTAILRQTPDLSFRKMSWTAITAVTVVI